MGDRSPDLAQRLALMEQGRCVCFQSIVTDSPLDWHKQPFEAGRSSADVPWFALPDFDANVGDARTLWEPARAAWAIDVAKGKANGISAGTPQLFWDWLDGWMTACPPWNGFHWKCGQEASIRFFALTFGFWAVADDPTPEQWAKWARLAWATGYRVERHLHYAVSQNNNHALNEACGLMWIAHLFPEFRKAQKWWRLGRRTFARCLARQIYSDGSYVQHSMNYHRVMLQVSLLAFRIAELAGEPFHRHLYDRLQTSVALLSQLVDSTGQVPNYGNNDGSNILPFSECAQGDYRPVIQAVHYLVHRKRWYEAGPWDEDLLWLFGNEPSNSQLDDRAQPESSGFPQGGYFTLRRSNSWAMIRCHTYRDRPGQCDPLHVDLWWRGINVLRDSGLYRYFDPKHPARERFFKSIRSHNCIELDRADPAQFVSRFLSFPWIEARHRHFEPRGVGATWFEGEHLGYDRRPWNTVHRRTVVSLQGDAWVIIDDLLGRGDHTATLRWQLADMPMEERDSGWLMKTPEGQCALGVATRSSVRRMSVVRGQDDKEGVIGWVSPCYGTVQPAPTLEVAVDFSRMARLVTVFAEGDRAGAEFQEQGEHSESWQIETDREPWLLRLALADINAERVLLDQQGASREES